VRQLRTDSGSSRPSHASTFVANSSAERTGGRSEEQGARKLTSEQVVSLGSAPRCPSVTPTTPASLSMPRWFAWRESFAFARVGWVLRLRRAADRAGRLSKLVAGRELSALVIASGEGGKRSSD